jgi:F-type H+-transporting ATPase subunit b
MLELDWATLLFQIINFVVLMALLGYFLFRPLRRKLDERGQIIAETLQRARDQEAEAKQLREQWEERMRTVDQQAEESAPGRRWRGLPLGVAPGPRR